MKKGDKVRVVKLLGDTEDFKAEGITEEMLIGATGKVKEISNRYEYPIDVELLIGNKSKVYGFKEEELQLLEDIKSGI